MTFHVEGDHLFKRSEARLTRLKELSAPHVVVENEEHLLARALEELKELGWDGGSVRVHHTPYELDSIRSPTGLRIYKRALALTALSERAMLESDGETNAISQLQVWAHCLDDEFEAHEQKFMFDAPGSVGKQTLIQFSWLIEGAVALAWALGVSEPLPHDVSCTPKELTQELGLLRPGRLEDEALSLRPKREVIDAFERMWAVHWRLVDFRVRPFPKSFDELGKRAHFWFGPLATEGVPTACVRAVGQGDANSTKNAEVNDLAIRGRAISEASNDERDECESIALERRKALGWACGLAYRFSEVPTDT